jgi:hypothetical protein
MTEESKFELTREDFINSGWQTVTENSEKKESHYYSSAFYSKFNE